MTDGPEFDLEERLREHYRYLRDAPLVEPPAPQRPRLLTAAASLVVVLLAIGVYLGVQNNRGQPVEAGPVASTDDGQGQSVDPAQTDDDGEDAERPSPESDQPTTIEVESADDDAAGSDNEADDDPNAGPESSPSAAGPQTINIDGSPKAPEPGTVAPPVDAELSMAYGIWEPGPADTCSKAIHDSSWTYGPDGKVYPTFHPPVDPDTGCTFGHEHGRDPAGSDLADIPFPFGYVDELAIVAGGEPNDDHVGHKIEWYNDGGYYESGSSEDSHDQVCDVAYKIHMDTNSDRAFGDNTHEVFHYARCENGAELVYRALVPFGASGEFNQHCDQGAGPAVAYGRPGETGDQSLGGREVPSSPCFLDRVLVPEGQSSDWFAFDERWTLYQSVDSEDFGRFFIQFFFYTDLPSRYWDGEQLARTVDLCYLTGELQVRNDELCDPMRAANPGTQVRWDESASPFNGADRQIFMGDLQLDNRAGQTDWYTDLSGEMWRAEPFAGSIRQYVGTTPIRAAASYRPDPIRHITSSDDLGIHAPN